MVYKDFQPRPPPKNAIKKAKAPSLSLDSWSICTYRFSNKAFQEKAFRKARAPSWGTEKFGVGFEKNQEDQATAVLFWTLRWKNYRCIVDAETTSSNQPSETLQKITKDMCPTCGHTQHNGQMDGVSVLNWNWPTRNYVLSNTIGTHLINDHVF